MSRSTFAGAALAVFMTCAVAAGQSTTIVSISSTGVQGNKASNICAVSANGRFVAFTSYAVNLVPGDTNANQDIFVRDCQLGTTERVSVDSAGMECNSGSSEPSISADGNSVAFASFATNLIAGDTNGVMDIFVRNRATGTTELVSQSTAGVQSIGHCVSPSISSDGRFVAFTSLASNLVAGDTNGAGDTFVRDRLTGVTELVSVATGGTQGDQNSGTPAISADGRFVAFESFATNLIAVDTNGVTDIFVRDRAAGTTVLASLHTSGAQSDAASTYVSISADGRFVGFESEATTLVDGDTNLMLDVFVRDLVSATTERASVASSGVQGNDKSSSPSLSADGRYVAFQSHAWNLVAGDLYFYGDTFVRDRLSGVTERVSVSAAGVQGNGHSYRPSVSSDGRYVAFSSLASNFAGVTNNFVDVFLRDRWPQSPTPYCTAGTTSNSCTAQIAANALPSLLLAHACDITVTGVEGLKSGILFYGVDNTGFTPGPWGAGSTSYLCVKSPTQRAPIQNSGGTFGACDGTYVLDWNAYQTANPFALGNPWSVGAHVFAQAWFRDPPALNSTGLSNAVEMMYVP